MVARKVTVSGSAAYGLPTALDEDVLLALIQLTKHQAFSAKRVYFSRSQLIRMLGWEENGQSYARILSALNKWLGVNVMWNKAWRDYTREDAVWEDNGIVLIQDFQLKRGANACHITWADQMFESFLSGSVKALDFGLYRRLGTATAKRMYRFLDKRFYTRSALVFDLATFAHEKIGIKRTCAVYNLKGMLKPAIKELVAVGFLKDASDKERYRKREPGKWDVCFELAVADNQKDSIPLVEEETGNIPSLERELISRGVTKSRARRLVGKCSDELVKAKIEEFDFLMSRKGKKLNARRIQVAGWPNPFRKVMKLLRGMSLRSSGRGVRRPSPPKLKKLPQKLERSSKPPPHPNRGPTPSPPESKCSLTACRQRLAKPSRRRPLPPRHWAAGPSSALTCGRPSSGITWRRSSGPRSEARRAGPPAGLSLRRQAPGAGHHTMPHVATGQLRPESITPAAPAGTG